MLSLYVDGDSPLHRCPAGWKMGVFAVWVLALTLLPASVGTAGAAVIGADASGSARLAAASDRTDPLTSGARDDGAMERGAQR